MKTCEEYVLNELEEMAKNIKYYLKEYKDKFEEE